MLAHVAVNNAAEDPAESVGPDVTKSLWPFGRVAKEYQQLDTALYEAQGHPGSQAWGADVAVILSASAYPGPWLAARSQNLKCFVLTQRVSKHCLKHGQELFKALTGGAFLTTRGNASDAKVQAIEEGPSMHQNIILTMPPISERQQGFCASEVAKGGNAFDGLDRNFSPLELRTALQSVRTSEKLNETECDNVYINQ